MESIKVENGDLKIIANEQNELEVYRKDDRHGLERMGSISYQADDTGFVITKISFHDHFNDELIIIGTLDLLISHLDTTNQNQKLKVMASKEDVTIIKCIKVFGFKLANKNENIYIRR